ncbi:tail completion protein gp17, partial [Cronobacter sakazakii]|uniref:tail completion protein gp17 n=1 Tax=Cronobacter sakazakii TaxID=28141 RepID=UPI000A19B02A
MTEADIYARLSTLAGGNVFPYVAPQGTAAPWVVFLLPSSASEDVLCGPAETDCTVQVDAWASSIDDTRPLREQVKSAFADLHPVGLNEINGYEPDTALNHATL